MKKGEKFKLNSAILNRPQYYRLRNARMAFTPWLRRGAASMVEIISVWVGENKL